MSAELDSTLQEWENELKGPVPRRVRPRSPGQAAYAWANLGLFAAAGLLLVALAGLLGSRMLAAHFGSAAQGVITEANVISHEGGAENFILRVEFTDASNSVRTANPEVTKAYYQVVKTGQKVGLHYFTWLPVMASLDNGTQSSPIFPSVAGCLGLLMLLAPLWRIWRERSLLVSGSLIRGEVAGTYHNKTISTYKVKYAAKDRSFQRTFIAFEATLRFHDYGPAIVVADPKRPGRACLYSDVSFWKAEV